MSLLLQKTGFYALNSEWKKVSAGSHSSLAHAFLLLTAFWCHLVHFLGEKSILPYFSSLSMVAILDCDSHSQAGSTTLPQIWLSKRSTLKLSVSFQALCDKVKWNPDAADKSPCTWEGWAVVSAQFGDQEVTLFGLYFFRIHSQGVVALVSVSDGKTKITILILRRGTCLGGGGGP